MVRLLTETNGSMLFRAGEIDNDLWELKMEEGEDPPWTAKAEGDCGKNVLTDRRG